MRKIIFALALAAALAGLGAAAFAAEPADPAETLRLALMLGCGDAKWTPAQMAAQVPGALAARQEPIPPRGPPSGTKWTFALPGGGQVLLESYTRGGRILTLLAEYDEPQARGPRPLLAAVAGEGCFLASGRRLLYDESGHAVAVELLDARMESTSRRELLVADPPNGRDPGGVTVAQADTGVNYLLPEIA
ncbi:MAG TPA: hypothetical protein VJ487_08640, partial [Alphaproteobacteria bacterium]|nr:hypothetical protein [Alphaproteobacteria bacterium]